MLPFSVESCLSNIQAPAGHQSCPFLGTKFLWLFLKLYSCGLGNIFNLQEPNVIMLHLARGSWRDVI